MSYHNRGNMTSGGNMSTPRRTTSSQATSNPLRSRRVQSRVTNTAARNRNRNARRRAIVGQRRRRAVMNQATVQQQIRRRNFNGTVSAGPSARGRNASIQVSRGYKKKYAISESEGYATVRTGRGNYSRIVKKTGAALDRGQKGLRK